MVAYQPGGRVAGRRRSGRLGIRGDHDRGGADRAVDLQRVYPRVMVSSTKPAYNLTIHNTASANYALKVMTIVVVIALPVVLAYTAWTYYVFRRRLTDKDFQAQRST
jgi:hypothetical protein